MRSCSGAPTPMRTSGRSTQAQQSPRPASWPCSPGATRRPTACRCCPARSMCRARTERAWPIQGARCSRPTGCAMSAIRSPSWWPGRRSKRGMRPSLSRSSMRRCRPFARPTKPMHRAHRCCINRSAPISACIGSAMTVPRSKPLSPALRRRCGSSWRTTASSAIRWSRASPSGNGRAKPAGTSCIRRRRAPCACATGSRTSPSRSPRTGCAWCRPMSAAGSGCAASCFRKR